MLIEITESKKVLFSYGKGQLCLFLSHKDDMTEVMKHVFQIFKFKSANQTLQCDRSNESYWAVLPCDTVYYVVKDGSNL